MFSILCARNFRMRIKRMSWSNTVEKVRTITYGKYIFLKHNYLFSIKTFIVHIIYYKIISCCLKTLKNPPIDLQLLFSALVKIWWILMKVLKLFHRYINFSCFVSRYFIESEDNHFCNKNFYRKVYSCIYEVFLKLITDDTIVVSRELSLISN